MVNLHDFEDGKKPVPRLRSNGIPDKDKHLYFVTRHIDGSYHCEDETGKPDIRRTLHGHCHHVEGMMKAWENKSFPFNPSESDICATCGAKIVEYKHTLNIPLVRALSIIANSGDAPVNIAQLKLSKPQWTNFQKLRYFCLVERYYEDDKRVGGVWKITNLGRSFLKGESAIHKSVWTYRGEFIRWDGAQVKVTDIDEGYEYREDWAAEAVPHTGD